MNMSGQHTSLRDFFSVSATFDKSKQTLDLNGTCVHHFLRRLDRQFLEQLGNLNLESLQVWQFPARCSWQPSKRGTKDGTVGSCIRSVGFAPLLGGWMGANLLGASKFFSHLITTLPLQMQVLNIHGQPHCPKKSESLLLATGHWAKNELLKASPPSMTLTTKNLGNQHEQSINQPTNQTVN